ncbi:MAG: SET domain-containing protein [Flavobacterium sp.]|nr:SET domain-containing protein [Flavobacterium sp.]
MPENDNIIQAQESDYLYVQTSQLVNAGKGLFTAIPIYKDEIIAYYGGEILSEKEVKKRMIANKDQYFINLLDGTTLDSIDSNCFAKYANDAKGLMLTNFKNNANISLDDSQKVCLIASKNIKTGEEILCSYGKKYWKKYKN